eukprot:symbB.v1.2.009516.t2/scaffold606.1/size182035/6
MSGFDSSTGTQGAPSLSQQLKEAEALVREKAQHERRDEKVTDKVLRLRGLPWTAGAAEVAQFLHEYGITEKDVTMCVTESGRPDGHAWEKQRASLGGRFIEFFPWKDHSKEKPQAATTTKMYTGILKHFDAQRKCGYIYSLEADVGKLDIYVFKDLLERGKASVGDALAFPLHWSPKGQPQASSPLIRIAAKDSYAHTGRFKMAEDDKAGLIECMEVTQVLKRNVYVSPSMAATLTPGSLVAFNCYLASMPAAFARAPLDGAVPVCSAVRMVEQFDPPAAELQVTCSAPGFESFESQERWRCRNVTE